MDLKLLRLKSIAKLLNHIEKNIKLSPGPVFWGGKDITGNYHDKNLLRETMKEKKREKKNK
jgi:hypothetical protein